MPYANRYENAGAINNVAQGAGAAGQPTTPFTPTSNFQRMLILEVISDPANIVDDKKIAYWGGILKVSNVNYAAVLPRNTIIAQKIRDDTAKPMFVFPFFPSHLALPCKPGETVWTMVENTEAKFIDIAYWFCRITEPHHVDDVNHTHAPRIQETSNFPTLRQRQENDGKSNAKYELRNGIAITRGNERSTKASSFYVPGAEDIFEKLISDTDAAKLMQYESVPRFRKRPGDIALEGSNNTLLVLGTDRIGPISTLTVNQSQNNSVSPSPIPEDATGGSAGSIDLVAGRGQAPSTGGTIISTTSISKNSESVDGYPIKQEINKEYDSLSPFEGDPDLRNDRSRILISQRTNVDKNFGLNTYNEELKTAIVGGPHEFSNLPNGNAAIVIKSDKVRLISRSDVQLMVTGHKSDKNIAEKDVLTEKNDPSEWASITITSEGSIVFKPSKKGYIKLGSEKADRAILCTSIPAIATNGKVTSPPIIQPLATINPGMATATVMLGDETAGTAGSFASKILVDVSDISYPAPASSTPSSSPTSASGVTQSATSTPSKSAAANSGPTYPPEIKIPPGAILNSNVTGGLPGSAQIPMVTQSASQNFATALGGNPRYLSGATNAKPPSTNNLQSQLSNGSLPSAENIEGTSTSIIEDAKKQDTIIEQFGQEVKGLDPRFNRKKYSP